MQSYQLLQPGPQDLTNAILIRMSTQLESFKINSSFANSTTPSFNESFTPSSFEAPTYAVWLNAVWFTSLIFSLASATIGIIVKQWIKTYNTGLYGRSRDIARRRQRRLNNLRKWHVATAVALVPVMLIIALILFLAGLLILLYSIHLTVALVASVFAGLLLLFIAITTVLPTAYRSCCYHSPQSAGVLLLKKNVYKTLAWIVGLVCQTIDWINTRRPLHRRYIAFVSAARKLFPAPQQPSPFWRELELSTATQMDIDNDIMITAYSAGLDPVSIDNASTWFSGDSVEGYLKTGVGYMCKLKGTLQRHRGSQQQWPAQVRDRLVAMARHMLQASLTIAPVDLQGAGRELVAHLLHEVKDILDWEDISQDEKTQLRALFSMSRQHKMTEADAAWEELSRADDVQDIGDPIAYRIGA